MGRARRRGWAIAALGAAAALAGCSAGDPFDNEFAQYGQRIATVTPTAGNTQAANAAIQTIDPWPRYAYDKHIPGNGALSVKAVHEYESGGGQAASGGATTVNVFGGGGH